MRLGAIPETPLEWLGLRLGRVPTPLIDTHLAFAFARTVMVAARVGVFEALAEGPASPEEVARRCGTAPVPTRRLVMALVGVGYLIPAGAEQVALGRHVRRWLTRDSATSVLDKVAFAFDEWRLVEGYEDYVRRGVAVGMHGVAAAAGRGAGAGAPLSAADAPSSDGGVADAVAANDAWGRYQRGLRAVAVVSADEVARRTPVPTGARRLIDLGGGHGLFAAALLRRHPALRATVLDLAPAVDAALAVGVPADLRGRLEHRVADALNDPLGDGDVDVVFASQLNHHFGEADNRALAARVAAALRSGGVYVVQDLARPADPREARRARLGALLDLYFGATSDGGTYPIAAMRAWQTDAGLRPARVRWLRTLPGLVQQAAVKP
ncbi:MAG: class I SAM-dependent methyltransferase [Trueperaceae bacterium]